ncbi:CRTAC1 family protein [Granulicella aggregans]|uniref:CRTAC1 family protein n=1 Tax=Granulicella aggregans TaxID=474949 RepID=UPI0021DFEB04|nr:CRTAC1 family protein [Granulicella aggregans]
MIHRLSPKLNRRRFIRSLSRTALVLPFADILALAAPAQQQSPVPVPGKIGPQERSYEAKPAPPPPGPKSPIEGTPLGVTFTDVAAQAGLTLETIYGGKLTNKYLLETTGCGLAFYDYDNDGWQDLFFVNGWRLEGFPAGSEPRCHLFKNNRDGTFTDVTKGSGLEHKTGWGQACCVGDYNNDGNDDLFVTYYGQNVLYRNNGNGTFTDVTEQAGLKQPGPKIRWNTGCTFVDYDRDGHLDLFVANYVDFDLKTAPLPEDGPCTYKGILVACGPPGLAGGRNILYHNNGDGTFSDVSEKSGMWTAVGTYGLSVAASDLDNDGWPDIYVANDSAPATLYQNQHDGTFRDIAIEAGAALSAEAKPQAGMGVSIGDYNRDGNMDVVKTNFAGDTDSLYTNNGEAVFEDRTYPGGLGENTRLLGWGVGFFDMNNDGWPDILMSNGHVYPEVDKSKADLKYAEHKYLYRNLQNGRFEDVTNQGGPGILANVPARGCAFGDIDNDGDIDVVVNCINSVPQLLRCDSTLNRNWIKIKLVGTKSNRSGIGSRVIVTTMTNPASPKPLQQTEELRSGGSYFSQNDLRLHFGLDQAKKVDTVEIRWLSGHIDVLHDLKINLSYTIQEGGVVLKAAPLTPARAKTS